MNLFDKTKEYDDMLNKGIFLSGEDKYFFAEGRLKDLRSMIPKEIVVKKILDFGCGLGDTISLLHKYFPDTIITGVDTSGDALEYAREKNKEYPHDLFLHLDDFNEEDEYDLCYVNGVFHHIPIAQRNKAARMIFNSLKSNGLLALFENNPINPGTKWVMSRIPFDHDAITLFHWELKKLLKSAGFMLHQPTRFLFYFPRILKWLRSLEPLLVHLPFGAQYYIIATKQ